MKRTVVKQPLPKEIYKKARLDWTVHCPIKAYFLLLQLLLCAVCNASFR